jgi:hypothetical protein
MGKLMNTPEKIKQINKELREMYKKVLEAMR